MTLRKKTMAIVGNGMATSKLLDELIARRADERYKIIVFGDEPGGAYNRILLSKVLGGAKPDAIVMKDESWYREAGIELVSGVVVERLDPHARLIHARGTAPLRYDVAVLATGSLPVVPAISGITLDNGELKPGVFLYRTMNDCVRMREHARAGDNAVVFGGGLLGLEAAKVLSDRGLHVTVIHLSDSLMNNQLDFVAGQMLERQIEHCGIFVRTRRTAEAILGEEAVEGVVLDDGQQLAADMLVLACGVRPRVDLAKVSKIPVNRGIVVNDTLATAIPGIYAVGECVEHTGRTYGLVAPVYEQVAVLADVLSGADPTARYRGSKLHTRLKVAGVEVASMGLVQPELESDEVLQVVEERKHSYRKIIVRNRQLVGAMLVGNTTSAARLVQMFDRGDTLPEEPLDILCSADAAGGAASAGDRVICNCTKVTESAVVTAIGAGATSVESVSIATRAGTGCGSCKTELAQLVSRHARRAAVANAE